MTIEEKYQELLKIPSDVNQNFPLIRKSVEKGDRVVELGVRNCVSTWALLAGEPAALISVDVANPPQENLQEVKDAAKEAGIVFRFIQEDSLILSIETMDVLFLDTLHLYSHLMKELWRYSGGVKKRIIFHDWKIPEVRSCVQDFLYCTDWELEEVSWGSNGLAVVKRVSLL